MGAPTVYRWDDTDAPVLSGTAGSLIAVLDACLINGYGTQPPLGWTKPFTGLNKGVYRNNAVSGTGSFLRFDDASPYGDNTAEVQGYESMTDVDTGLAPCPLSVTGKIYKSNVASTDPRPWFIIGDDLGFYLFIARSTIGGVVAAQDYFGHDIMFFGDGVSAVPGDAYFFIVAVDTSWSVTYPGRQMQFEASEDISTMRSSDGTVGSVVSRHKGGSTLHTPVSAAGSSGLVHPFNGQTVFARSMIDDATFLTSFSLRGYFPGLYYPVHASPLDNFTETAEGTLNLLAIKIRVYSAQAQVCIDTAVGFRP